MDCFGFAAQSLAMTDIHHCKPNKARRIIHEWQRMPKLWILRYAQYNEFSVN